MGGGAGLDSGDVMSTQEDESEEVSFATVSAFAAAMLDIPNCLNPNVLGFGKFAIHLDVEVFHSTVHSVCLVNLKPIVPGHCLIIPRRRTALFAEL